MGDDVRQVIGCMCNVTEIIDTQVHSDVNVQNIIDGTLQTTLYWSVTDCSIQPLLCLFCDPRSVGTDN
jgi:hypothetical protein